MVYIGLEPAYQRWCGQLAQKARRFSDLILPNLRVQYDSRWPAILYGNSLELAVYGLDDVLRDVYYTAAVWQVIRDRVPEDRACVEVYMMKRLCKFGCGAGLVHRDLLFLEEKVDLLVRPRSRLAKGPTAAMWPKTSELACTAEQMVEQAEEAPEKPIRWEGDHLNLMKQCVAMAQEWRGRVPPGESLSLDFGDFEERSQTAVNMAIGYMTLHEDSQMAVAWINHRYGHSCAALRAATLSDPRLLTECGRQVLCCLADFAVEPNWLTLAFGPKPPPSLPRERILVRNSEPWARASGVAICSKERPPPVPTWHMVPVPETPVVAPQPRLRLPAPPPA